MKNKFDYSIIIPVFNEERRIKKTIIDVLARMSKVDGDFEFIFVNDGSTDGTVHVIKQGLAETSVSYKIKSFTQNKGKGAAIKEGILVASGKVIILFDADNSTKIDELKKLNDTIKEFNFIIGSRYLAGSDIEVKQSIIRLVISRIGNLLIRMILNLDYTDTQCGFKVLDSNSAKYIASRMQINRWGFDIEMLTIAKLKKIKVKEVPVAWANSSDSKLNASGAAWQTFKELLLIRKNCKMRLYD